MALNLVTAAATPILSTADAKEHLSVDFADDDALIASYVLAATEMVDAEFGELGRALVSQTWAQTFGGFDLPMSLDLSPVQSVASITYYDADNAQQTWAAENYRLTAEPDAAFIEIVDGVTSPATYPRRDAVAVNYIAGFGAASDVPEGIKQAVRLMVGHWYENRNAVDQKGMAAMPIGVRSLLSKYRVARGFI